MTTSDVTGCAACGSPVGDCHHDHNERGEPLCEGCCGTCQTIRAHAAAQFVAEHWRDHAMTWPQPLNAAAHPLAMVLGALTGETDPVELGLEPEVHEAFEAAIRGAAVPVPDPEGTPPNERRRTTRAR